MKPSSCSIVGLRKTGAVSRMKSFQNWPGSSSASRRRRQPHQPLLEALRLERAREGLLGDEDDPVAAPAQHVADPDAVVGRPVGALREEDDRARGLAHATASSAPAVLRNSSTFTILPARMRTADSKSPRANASKLRRTISTFSSDIASARRTLSSPANGAWRSLVAHSAGGRAVAGSNPVAPTSRDPPRRSANEQVRSCRPRDRRDSQGIPDDHATTSCGTRSPARTRRTANGRRRRPSLIAPGSCGASASCTRAAEGACGDHRRGDGQADRQARGEVDFCATSTGSTQTTPKR